MAEKLLAWIEIVEIDGLEEAKNLSGFRDESLKGLLKGKRSIRLSKKWRAIYCVERGVVEFVLVEKVTPHEYKK